MEQWNGVVMDMNKLVKLIIAELSNKELESYLSDSQKEYIAFNLT